MTQSWLQVPVIPRKKQGLRDAGFGGSTPYVAADTGIDTLSGFLPTNTAVDAEVR